MNVTRKFFGGKIASVENPAKRLLKFFDYFLAVDSSAVPQNSLVKEFIGGSVFTG